MKMSLISCQVAILSAFTKGYSHDHKSIKVLHRIQDTLDDVRPLGDLVSVLACNHSAEEGGCLSILFMIFLVLISRLDFSLEPKEKHIVSAYGIFGEEYEE